MGCWNTEHVRIYVAATNVNFFVNQTLFLKLLFVQPTTHTVIILNITLLLYTIHEGTMKEPWRNHEGTMEEPWRNKEWVLSLRIVTAWALQDLNNKRNLKIPNLKILNRTSQIVNRNFLKILNRKSPSPLSQKPFQEKPVSIQENIRSIAGLTNADNQQVVHTKRHWHFIWHYAVPVFNSSLRKL
jgi:hypothetical protein